MLENVACALVSSYLKKGLCGWYWILIAIFFSIRTNLCGDMKLLTSRTKSLCH